MLSTSKSKPKSKASSKPSTTQKEPSRSEKMWKDLNRTPATQTAVKPKSSIKASKPEAKTPQALPLYAIGTIVHGAHMGDKGCYIAWYGKIAAAFKIADHDYFEYVIRRLYHAGRGPAPLSTYLVEREGSIYLGLPGWIDATKMVEAP